MQKLINKYNTLNKQLNLLIDNITNKYLEEGVPADFMESVIKKANELAQDNWNTACLNFVMHDIEVPSEPKQFSLTNKNFDVMFKMFVGSIIYSNRLAETYEPDYLSEAFCLILANREEIREIWDEYNKCKEGLILALANKETGLPIETLGKMHGFFTRTNKIKGLVKI